MKKEFKMEKLVSIVIPVYNAEKYVGACITSFLNQTYKNIELLLIDDGSKDYSLKKLEEYRTKAPEKIKIYTQENKGVAYTRNKGIKCAHGEYIMFSDNDDYAEPEYVATMVAEIEKKAADMIVGSCRKVNGKHEKLFEQILSDDEWSKFRVIAPWARIIRRQFLLEHDVQFGDFKVGEDSFFSITAYNESNRIYTTPYIGYNWVQREDSVSNTIQKKGIANPIPFLEALIQRNAVLKNIKQEYFEYFIIKFLIWNLYYISNDVEKAELLKTCERYFSWLREYCPAYQKNKLLHIGKPKGENLSIRVLVCLMAKSGNTGRRLILRGIRKSKKILNLHK